MISTPSRHHPYHQGGIILLPFSMCFMASIILVGHVAAFQSNRHAPSLTSFSTYTPRYSSSAELYMNGLKLDFDDDDNDKDGKSGGGGLTFEENAPRIFFRAKKKHEVQVEMTPEALEENRSLLHYLALPAEQYSVLDAGTIMKKSSPNANNNEFTCAVDAVNFLGHTLEASIDAVVDVSDYPRGKSVIRVVNCTLSGSKLAQLANGRFDVDCTNVVLALPSVSTVAIASINTPTSGDGFGEELEETKMAAQAPKARSKSRLGRWRDNIMSSTKHRINSNVENDDMTEEQRAQQRLLKQQESDGCVDMLSVDCQLEISALVPNEGKWLPKRLVGKSGSVVMQSLLSVLVPRFVDQLAADYQKWSAGDDSRAPVVSGTKADADANTSKNNAANDEAYYGGDTDTAPSKNKATPISNTNKRKEHA